MDARLERMRGWFRFKKSVYGEPVAAAAQEPVGGAFVDDAALRSFPGATLVASCISGLVDKLTGLTSDWVPAACGFAVGLVILYLNFTDPKAPPAHRGRAFIIGLINALLVACSVLGVYRAGGDISVRSQPHALVLIHDRGLDTRL